MSTPFISKTCAFSTRSNQQRNDRNPCNDRNQWRSVHRKPTLYRGFGALIAVLLSTLGVSAVSFSVLGASVSFSDSIDKRESRVQAQLNQKACDDSAALIKEKDTFAAGVVDFPEFGCSASI